MTGPLLPLQIRGFVDEPEEDIFIRDLDAFDDLEAREPAGGVGSVLYIFITNTH
jgi:hypothetical protein